jgi:hypothetical protein
MFAWRRFQHITRYELRSGEVGSATFTAERPPDLSRNAPAVLLKPFVRHVEHHQAAAGEPVTTSQIALPLSTPKMMSTPVDLDHNSCVFIDEINPRDESVGAAKCSLPIWFRKTVPTNKLDKPGFERALGGPSLVSVNDPPEHWGAMMTTCSRCGQAIDDAPQQLRSVPDGGFECNLYLVGGQYGSEVD